MKRILILLLLLSLLACDSESPFPEKTKIVWLENNADVPAQMGEVGNLINVNAGVFMTTKVIIPEGMEKISKRFTADAGQAVSSECAVKRDGRMKIVYENQSVYCIYL